MLKTFMILALIFSLTTPVQSETITNKDFNLKLQLPADWVSLPTTKKSLRIFDLIRYYPITDTKEIVKKNMQKHIAARIFLQYKEQLPNENLIKFSQKSVKLLRIKGFEQHTTATLIKTGTPHIHYTLLHQPLKQIGNNKDNTLWMSLRFFKMNKKFFLFISMAKSKKELRDGKIIFETLGIVKLP